MRNQRESLEGVDMAAALEQYLHPKPVNYRNADTDAIDAQLRTDKRSFGKKAFDAVAAPAGYIIRGALKTVGLTFAIAVGGATAIYAGNRALEDAPKASDIATLMQHLGIQNMTPEEFVEQLREKGILDSEKNTPQEIPGVISEDKVPRVEV